MLRLERLKKERKKKKNSKSSCHITASNQMLQGKSLSEREKFFFEDFLVEIVNKKVVKFNKIKH